MPERQWIAPYVTELSHGIRIAAEMMDTHGEAAAMAWFHEHEQLPIHPASECPPITTDREAPKSDQ